MLRPLREQARGSLRVFALVLAALLALACGVRRSSRLPEADGLTRDSNSHGGHSQLEGGVLLRGGGNSSIAEEWVVMLKQAISAERLAEVCSRHEATAKCKGAGKAIPFVEVHASERGLEEFLAGVGWENVDYVESDRRVNAVPEVLPGEARMRKEVRVKALPGSSWGLDRIGMNWASRTGHGVEIYVIDTGIHMSHQDFGGRAKPLLQINDEFAISECTSSQGECAEDGHGHGTHCAATAGGSAYGVAPDARLYAAKTQDDQGRGDLASVIGAIDHVIAHAHPPAVLSMSLGSPGRDKAYGQAITQATSSGIVVVVAAGNEGDDACGYSPSYVPAAITVGATDQRDNRAFYSNYGPCVDIYAPGSDIVSASHLSEHGTATQSGTSQATPHVVGAAALILEEHPDWSPVQVRSQLLATAEKNRIRNMRASDPNYFLRVAWEGHAEGKDPPPPVKPAPQPMKQCPAFAKYAQADPTGDCKCPWGSKCFLGDGNCSLSDGGQSVSWFSADCAECECRYECPGGEAPDPSNRCRCPQGTECYQDEEAGCLLHLVTGASFKSSSHFPAGCQLCECVPAAQPPDPGAQGSFCPGSKVPGVLLLLLLVLLSAFEQ